MFCHLIVMIGRFIIWLFFAIIGLILLIVLLPIILLIVLVALIVGLFSGAKLRVWTSRAQAGAREGADMVRSKFNQHTVGSVKSAKPGQRKATVVDANTRDI